MEENKKNLEYYNRMASCPDTAKKQIKGGRLAGMSDVNPMWRIKKMTEVFGMCGIGWRYEITKQWNEAFGNEIKTYCNINLYVKVDGEWSEAIQGTGGSSFVTNESRGTFVSDENYKMALTDALSVAMKALGMAADVYWEAGRDYETKYSPIDNAKPVKQAPKESLRTKASREAGKDFDTMFDEAVDKLEDNQQGGVNDLDTSEVISNFVVPSLAQCSTKEDVTKVFNSYYKYKDNEMFLDAMASRVNQLFISKAKTFERLTAINQYFVFLKKNKTFVTMLNEKRTELTNAA